MLREEILKELQGESEGEVEENKESCKVRSSMSMGLGGLRTKES